MCHPSPAQKRSLSGIRNKQAAVILSDTRMYFSAIFNSNVKSKHKERGGKISSNQ